MIRCLWCGKAVIFDYARGGWLHAATGQLYATKIVDGIARDDHAALPSYE